MPKGYVRLDKVRAHVDNIYCATDLENGSIIQRTGVMSADGESFQVVAPTDVTNKYAELMMHVSVPMVYDNTRFNEREFFLPATKVGRAYHLYKGDIFSVSTDMLTGAPAVGDTYVPVNGSFKLSKAAAVAQTAAFKCVALESIGYGTSTVPLAVLQVL